MYSKSVPPGSHSWRVTAPGFSTVSGDAVVESNKTSTIPVTLTKITPLPNTISLAISSGKLTGTTDNFTIMIRLSSSSGITGANLSRIFTDLGSAWQKIHVRADGSECYTEVSIWDTVNQLGILWAKIPSMSGSSVPNLTLAYDPAGADNSYIGATGSTAAKNAWDGDHTHIYHCNEVLTGADGEVRDSKGSVNGVGKSISGGLPGLTPGPFGYGFHYNSSYIDLGDHPDFSHDSIINPDTWMGFSCWISFNWSSWQQFFDMGTDWVNPAGVGFTVTNMEWQMTLYQRQGDPRNVERFLCFYHYPMPLGPNGLGGGCGLEPDNQGSIWSKDILTTLNTWYYVQMGMGHGYTEIFAENGPGHWSTNLGGGYSGESGFWPRDGSLIPNVSGGGAPCWFGRNGSTERVPNCSIGEIRFSKVNRSRIWQNACYHSEKDKLITYAFL